MRSVEIGGAWFSVVGLGGIELEDDPDWPGARDVVLVTIVTPDANQGRVRLEMMNAARDKS